MIAAALWAWSGFSLGVLGAVLLMMIVELRVSLVNERTYRRLGAVDVADPVYRVMRVAYPGCFIVMAMEGLVTARVPDALAYVGGGVFVLSKALKVWAIRSLGHRWTYRVLILPGAALVTSGPYLRMRHPNYVAVVGELIGMALMMRALYTGPPATLLFVTLLWWRIAAEERALGLRH